MGGWTPADSVMGQMSSVRYRRDSHHALATEDKMIFERRQGQASRKRKSPSRSCKRPSKTLERRPETPERRPGSCKRPFKTLKRRPASYKRPFKTLKCLLKILECPPKTLERPPKIFERLLGRCKRLEIGLCSYRICTKQSGVSQRRRPLANILY